MIKLSRLVRGSKNSLGLAALGSFVVVVVVVVVGAAAVTAVLNPITDAIARTRKRGNIVYFFTRTERDELEKCDKESRKRGRGAREKERTLHGRQCHGEKKMKCDRSSVRRHKEGVEGQRWKRQGGTKKNVQRALGGPRREKPSLTQLFPPPQSIFSFFLITQSATPITGVFFTLPLNTKPSSQSSRLGNDLGMFSGLIRFSWHVFFSADYNIVCPDKLAFNSSCVIGVATTVERLVVIPRRRMIVVEMVFQNEDGAQGRHKLKASFFFLGGGGMCVSVCERSGNLVKKDVYWVNVARPCHFVCLKKG